MIDIVRLNEMVHVANSKAESVGPEAPSAPEAYDFGCMSLGESISHFQQCLLTEMVDRSHFRVGAHQIMSEAALTGNPNAEMLFEAAKDTAIQAWHRFIEAVKKFINGIIAKAKERSTLARGQYAEWIKIVEPKVAEVKKYRDAMSRTTSQAMPIYDIDYMKKGGEADRALQHILDDLIKAKDSYVADVKSISQPEEPEQTDQNKVAKLQQYAKDLNLDDPTKVETLQDIVEAVYKKCLTDPNETVRSFGDNHLSIDAMVNAIKEIPEVFTSISETYERELANVDRVATEAEQVQAQAADATTPEGEPAADKQAAMAQKTNAFQDRFSIQIQVINQVNAVRNSMCNKCLGDYSGAVNEFIRYKDPDFAERKKAEREQKRAQREKEQQSQRAQKTGNANTAGPVAY